MQMADVTLASFAHSHNGVPAAADAANCPTKARRQAREVNTNMVFFFGRRCVFFTRRIRIFEFITLFFLMMRRSWQSYR